MLFNHRHEIKFIMKSLPILILFIALAPSAFSWDLQLGFKQEKPRLGVGIQSYKNGKDTLRFQPTPMENISATGLVLGVQSENEWGGFYEKSQWKFPTSFTPTGGTDTKLDMKITSERLGINYEIKRELAGFFIGEIGRAHV